MKLFKYIKFNVKGYDFNLDPSCYVVPNERSLKNIPIPKNAVGFTVFYNAMENVRVDGKIMRFTTGPISKQNFEFRPANLAGKSYQDQMIDGFLSAKGPQIQNLNQNLSTRYVERIYESCHPEYDSFEERDLPSVDYFLLPKIYEKAKIIEEYCYPILVNGKKVLMRSQPIDEKTFYVGTVEKNDGEVVSFKTLKGYGAFAKPTDYIIDPSEIDENGIITNFNKRL